MKFERRVKISDLDYLAKKNKVYNDYKLSELYYKILENQYDKLHIVGVSENNELVAAAILHQVKRKLHFSDFKIIATPCIDFNNLGLLTFFHKNLMEYIKDYSGLTLTFNPNIEVINDDALNNLKSLGYVKNDKTKYLLKFNLEKNIEEFRDNYSNYIKSKLSVKFDFYNICDNLSIDLDKTYSLLSLQYSNINITDEDYKLIHKELYKDGALEHFVIEISLYKAMLYFQSRIKTCDEQYAITNDSSYLNAKESFNKYLERILELQKSYVDEITLSTITLIKNGHDAWCLFETKNIILSSFEANIYLFDIMIDYCYKNGIQNIYFEAVNPYDISLLEDKIDFGGEIIHLVDEFSIVVSPIFNKMVGN